MNVYDFLSSELGLEVLKALQIAQPRKSKSVLPRYMQITESGDYNNVVRVLDTNKFRQPKKVKPKQTKIHNVDENYDKLIKEFNIGE